MIDYFDEGYRARMEGKPLIKHPYYILLPGTDAKDNKTTAAANKAWRSGWQAADKDLDPIVLTVRPND